MALRVRSKAIAKPQPTCPKRVQVSRVKPKPKQGSKPCVDTVGASGALSEKLMEKNVVTPYLDKLVQTAVTAGKSPT